MHSPLGKYSQQVAVLVVILVILGYLIAVLLDLPNADDLLPFATLALGAVFGSAAATNGVKSEIRAANVRLDAVHAPPAPIAEAIVSREPRS